MKRDRQVVSAVVLNVVHLDCLNETSGVRISLESDKAMSSSFINTYDSHNDSQVKQIEETFSDEKMQKSKEEKESQKKILFVFLLYFLFCHFFGHFFVSGLR